VNADLGVRIAREASPRLAIDELAEAVEEAALLVLDSQAFDAGAEAQCRQLAHGVRQNCDADADFLEHGGGFIDAAGHLVPLEVERERKPADSPAHNGDFTLRRHRQFTALSQNCL